MSFLKKLLGTTDASPEEKAALEVKKAEKQKLKELQRQEQELQSQQKQKIREEQKQKQKALQEKYIGPGFDFSLYRDTISYFEQSILNSDEVVLKSIKAEYDKTKRREIKGLLIATDQRLVFVSCGVGHGIFQEDFDYRKINGIAKTKDGFFERELYIDMGRSRKKFDDILADQRLEEFISIVLEQINLSRSKTTTRKPTRKTSTSQADGSTDKYAALEKIAKLKADGILTEEEFQMEKTRILNS